VLFGTDMPWDSQDGERLVRETIRSVEEVAISVEERREIFEGTRGALPPSHVAIPGRRVTMSISVK